MPRVRSRRGGAFTLKEAGAQPSEWCRSRLGWEPGEGIGLHTILDSPTPVAHIPTGGTPAAAEDERAHSDIHKVGSHSCAYCSHKHGCPEELYHCIDAHADAAQGAQVELRAAQYCHHHYEDPSMPDPKPPGGSFLCA